MQSSTDSYRDNGFAAPAASDSSASLESPQQVQPETYKERQNGKKRPNPSTDTPKRSTIRPWLDACMQILPIYLATHIAFLLLTYLVNLFLLDNFSPTILKVHSIFLLWNHWDTSQFTDIATKGYDALWHAAFFPLYPLLEAGLIPVVHNAYYAGLIISNITTLCLFTVLYRLVQEEISEEHAKRTVLYMAVFPTAFFLSAAYNESLFLFFATFSFYQMRRGHWWLAGLLGCCASLTRSAGILLLVPFCYEYLRQHNFNPLRIRFGIAGGSLIPLGLGLFMLYCYLHFHNTFAFSDAQIYWGRHLQAPWQGFNDAYTVITKHGILSFDSIHNVIDMSAGLLMLVLLILCLVGPWRFRKERWVYIVYTATFYLFFLLFPSKGEQPLQSLSRFVIELFPVFIVLAAMGKREQFNLYYLTLSISLLAFMLLQFLTGRWIV